MLDIRDFDKANLILEDEPIKVEELESTGPRCPKCNSNNIAFGTQSKKRINWIQLMFSVLLAGPAPIISKAYHCFNCGNNFEQDEQKNDT
jgi:DNA-directed RNA polymerase subunit RPC12/RpoP